MSGRVILKFTKERVAESFIERSCLKIEGVKVDASAAAVERLSFRALDEITARATPSMRFLNPQAIDEEPLPRRLADQATDDLTFRAGCCENEWRSMRVSGVDAIKGTKTGVNGFSHRIQGIGRD